jgi:ribonuclease T2
MEAPAYFDLSRLAFALVTPPELDRRMTAAEIERAFLAANPDIGPDGLVVTCRDGALVEVRVCLDRALGPRDCGADVLRADCRARGPLDAPPIP